MLICRSKREGLGYAYLSKSVLVAGHSWCYFQFKMEPMESGPFLAAILKNNAEAALTGTRWTGKRICLRAQTFVGGEKEVSLSFILKN